MSQNPFSVGNTYGQLIGRQYHVPVYTAPGQITTYTYSRTFTEESNTVARTINLTNKDIESLADVYAHVRGRANGAVVQITPDQAEVIYWELSGDGVEWREPNCLPADYKLGTISRFEVVED